MAAAAAALIGVFIVVLSSAWSQHLGTTTHPQQPSGICLSTYCNTVSSLQRLKDCVVVVGNLRLVLMQKTISSHFSNITFPNLREVTGFVVLYRVKGLESVGQLFPNLTRIRGGQLINNYALIVHDMANLREVGLYSLLRIDRGGVIIWGGPHTCYVDTVDWNTIAPQSRHMLTYPEITAHCNMTKPCKCREKDNNYCWNSKKCQRFLSGPRAESCHPECLGCSGHDPDICSVCRHYTHRGSCVSRCPSHTILLPDSQYCVTTEECSSIGGWRWNRTCVFDCPIDYERMVDNGTTTCEPCFNCKKVCSSMVIDSLNGTQQSYKCVYIAGSLTIHVRSVPGAVEELKTYLRLIEVVTDYIHIYGSVAITSFDFLPSLRQIAGRKLKKNMYSLVVHDMKNLRELFTPKVMKNLQIDRGKLKIVNNPMLCMSKINEIRGKFPVPSNENEIPLGLNGYSTGCEDSVSISVQILNETAANIIFSPKNDSNIQYTVLYAKVNSESHVTLEPETCSESEWFAINADEGRVFLTSLNPAATYAVCVEIFVYSKDPLQSYVTRTILENFTMPFEKPEPPFIQEIVATSPNTISLQWTDHGDYRKHIKSYELDVILIDIPSRDVTLRDHCNLHYIYDAEDEYSRHAIVLRPPVEYQSCEANCFSLFSTQERQALIEDNFDICSSFKSECNQYDEVPPRNSTFKSYVKTLALNINGTKKLFHVKGLAPFRDYKFRLRSCAGMKCSRSTSAVIRTLRSKTADIPSITHSSVHDSNHISIKWEPPDETNGPIFVYLVQVLPGGTTTKETLPDVWCVYPEVRSLIVRSQFAKEFQVRVCSSTLGSFSACSEWRSISIPQYNVVVISIILSITLIVISVAIGLIYNRRSVNIDTVPLVDMTSMYRSESEVPAVMSTDFMPLYSVPLNDALLDY